MTKVIPWTLPTIAGGSSGGYTPQPTPEPEPTPQYYDFSEFAASFEDTYLKIGSYQSDAGSSATNRYEWSWYIYATLNYSGVTVIDDSQVSSVKLNYTIASGTTTDIEKSGSSKVYDIAEKQSSINIKSSIQSGGSSRRTIALRSTYSTSKTACTPSPSFTGQQCTVVSVVVYDADGNVLQEWTP